MSTYMRMLMAEVKAKNPAEIEFHQAVQEVAESLDPVLERCPEYREAMILERIIEPDRAIVFRVPWVDDAGKVRVNRGFRVEMNGAIGPYEGGLRFHPSVNLGILKFLAFDQVFKNSLSTLPMGGAKGGADFDPKGKSDGEVMRFCQSFMTELARHVGPNTDVPAGDIGVGGREIGYLFGQYRRIRNEFTGVLTGKGMSWGGSPLRREATGYGVAYFASQMLAVHGRSLEGKVCLVSGSGNVAQHVVEKLIDFGGKVVTISDSRGYIHDAEGLDRAKLEFLKDLKINRRGDLHEFAERFPSAMYAPMDPLSQEGNPLWDREADCAFPCATQNEISGRDAQNLLENGVELVCEGANMPTSAEAVRLFHERQILYAPGKAANAGGVVVAALERAQNSIGISWSRREVDERLRLTMNGIHDACLAAAEGFGKPGDYMSGANIAGFVRVADAMIDQGIV